jgi:hypothetical protein
MFKQKFILIEFCLAVMLLSNFACIISSSSSITGDEILRNNYELWKSKHMTNYSLDIRIRVFIPGSANLIHVEVRNSNVLKYTQETNPYASLPGWIIDGYDTIDKLFERIKTAYDEKADTITMSYDAEFGFPEYAEVNPESAVFDEEWGFTVTNFTPLENNSGD